MDQDMKSIAATVVTIIQEMKPDPLPGDGSESFGTTMGHVILHQAGEIERLRTALTTWDMDPHHYSKRPCGTCQQISDALGKPFGCIRYALTGEPYIKAAAQAAEGK